VKTTLSKIAQAKIADAVKRGSGDPLAGLTSAELAALARQASQAASDSRRTAQREREGVLKRVAQHVVDYVLADRSLARALSGGTISVRITDDRTLLRVQWRANRAPRRVVPELQRAFAAWAHAHVARGDIRKTLDLVEQHVAPWPAADLQAKRNSLKASVHRLRQADHAVLKLTTPEAVRAWTREKHAPRKIGDAMIALLRDER
jgi:hypothetical protein